MKTRRWTGLLAVTLAACGGSTVGSVGNDGGGDSASNGDAFPGDDIQQDAASNDVASDAPPSYLACFDASGTIDGSLKRCQSDADCVIKLHGTDCCGDQLYVGIDKASASQFDVCEPAWLAHFPGCGCAAHPPTTEDGKSTGFVDAATPRVHCTDFTMSGGICLTYLP